jgi:hypothetical protein
MQSTLYREILTGYMLLLKIKKIKSPPFVYVLTVFKKLLTNNSKGTFRNSSVRFVPSGT